MRVETIVSTMEQLAERKAERTGVGCLVVIVSAIAVIAFAVAITGRYDMALFDGGCHLEGEQSAYEHEFLSRSELLQRQGHSCNAAVEWLWSEQWRSGAGWQSEHYAPLRSGGALTPLVLNAFQKGREDPDQPRDRHETYRKILQTIRSSVSSTGAIGAADPELLEYPNYATSLALQCLVAENDPTDKPLIARMVGYLVGQQYCEATGFGPEHPTYGGWGFGGPRPVGGSPGHMDIGHTRHVLEALRAAGHDDVKTYARAERFLRIVQKHPTEVRPQPTENGATPPAGWKPPYDGGFYFSPIVLAANKGGVEKHAGASYFRSYATCTCDGILALLACGVPSDDERVRAAVGWLEKHPNLHYPEGVPKDSNENWGASIQFYHYAVRAECYRALNWPGPWESDLRNGLRMEQRADGSFVNRAGFLMKEDDPILCTALAVIALAAADSPATGAPQDSPKASVAP